MYVCACALLHVHLLVCACAHTCVCLRVHACVLIRVCMFVCVCVCADLIRHYFFRLDEQEGSIIWSRSREGSRSSNPNKVLVLEVHREPSNTVKNLPKFSPGDLHCYSFWVGTSGGVLDLLAYNEDAYNVWLIELERVASRNASRAPSALQAFKGTSVIRSRPSSSGGSLSGSRHTAKVGMSPGGGGAGTYREDRGGSVNTSVFVSDRQNRNGIVNDISHNSNNYTNKEMSPKGKQVAPLSSKHTPTSSPSSSRRSGLSFIGETVRSDRPDNLHITSSLPQGTVI